MSRFKNIPPLDMSEYFVTKDEKKDFHPNDWNLPLPWISAFIYTHLTAKFWGIWDTDIQDKPRVLQIGCAQGWDAVENAKILKLPMINGELHIIDWFKGNLTVNKEEEWAYNENNPETWKAHLWSEAKKFKVDDIITVFEGDSREQIHNVENNYYDIVFIDGGHEYDIVKSDVENGYNKLKDGGIMVFDDFTGGRDSYEKFNLKKAAKRHLNTDTYSFNGELVHCGVVKAVHEFFDGNYIVCGSHDKAYHIKGYKIQRDSQFL